MRVADISWNAGEGWRGVDGDTGANLVLFFGGREAMMDGVSYRTLRARYPEAIIVGCSTGGQIVDDEIVDEAIVGVAVQTNATPVKMAVASAPDASHSRSAGEEIARQLVADDLACVFVLSDGLAVNGSELVAGMVSVLGTDIPLTGGLAGDDDRFEQTLVSANCEPQSNLVAAIGFYGPAIHVGHGSFGGWDEFGPRRQITKSDGNVLYELDGHPALDLYERYLGEEEAKELPGSALLFPLRVRDPEQSGRAIVRTVLAIDRDSRSMTFAGDVPEGWTAQLMRGNFDRLADGAGKAARAATASNGALRQGDELAIFVSCIGRRLLMGEHAVEEVEAATAELESGVHTLGFYSYGEIAPHNQTGLCELHNQTMTVTALYETVG